MLIYRWEDEQLFVTQVMHGALKSDVSTHKVSIEKIHEGHRKPVQKLKKIDGYVYVTGDSSVLGGGFQPKQVYQHHLGSKKC